MNDLLVVIALVFLAATLAIYGIYWFFVFNRREQKVLNRRLELGKTLANPSVVLEALRQERGFSNFSNPVWQQLSDWLTQTGVEIRKEVLGLVFVFLFTVLLATFSLFLAFGAGTFILALVAASGLMFLFFNRRRSRRIALFGEQMPDAIDIITRGVRVGLPFQTAVALVAREMPDPIGTEFGMFADEVAFGLDLRTALENLYRRVGQEDLVFLIIAVTIQTQTGGNLGEILSRLSKLMRSRAKMRLKIRALSAEGRLSAIVLTILPFLLLLVINLLAPTYYGSVRGHVIIEPAIFISLALLLIGNVVMYRMVNFKY